MCGDCCLGFLSITRVTCGSPRDYAVFLTLCQTQRTPSPKNKTPHPPNTKYFDVVVDIVRAVGQRDCLDVSQKGLFFGIQGMDRDVAEDKALRVRCPRSGQK